MKRDSILYEIITTIISTIAANTIVLGSIGIAGYLIYFIGNMWFNWW